MKPVPIQARVRCRHCRTRVRMNDDEIRELAAALCGEFHCRACGRSFTFDLRAPRAAPSATVAIEPARRAPNGVSRKAAPPFRPLEPLVVPARPTRGGDAVPFAPLDGVQRWPGVTAERAGFRFSWRGLARWQRWSIAAATSVALALGGYYVMPKSRPAQPAVVAAPAAMPGGLDPDLPADPTH